MNCVKASFWGFFGQIFWNYFNFLDIKLSTDYPALYSTPKPLPKIILNNWIKVLSFIVYLIGNVFGWDSLFFYLNFGCRPFIAWKYALYTITSLWGALAKLEFCIWNTQKLFLYKNLDFWIIPDENLILINDFLFCVLKKQTFQ